MTINFMLAKGQRILSQFAKRVKVDTPISIQNHQANRLIPTCLLLFGCSLPSWAQDRIERFVVNTIRFEYLANDCDENQTRESAVYLPFGYRKSTQCNPIIYISHGFNGDPLGQTVPSASQIHS